VIRAIETSGARRAAGEFMTGRTIGRAPALVFALLAGTAITSPARAQTSDTPPPARVQYDSNGVDLARGTFATRVTDVAIGPEGRGGLAYVRSFGQVAAGGGSNWDIGLFQTDSSHWTATVGFTSYLFTLAGATYTSIDGSGATLANPAGGPVLTLPDGTKVVYGNLSVDTVDVQRRARGTSVTYPTGETVSLAWTNARWCNTEQDGCPAGHTNAVRLQSVSSSLGYQLHFEYGLADAVDGPGGEEWRRLVKVTALNTTVDSCSPTANACAFSRTWPSATYSGTGAVTDALQRTTVYTLNGTGATVRRPSNPGGSAPPNVAVGFDSNLKVSSVDRDGMHWGYAWSLSGTTATMTIVDPLNHQTVVTSDANLGLPTAIEDPLHRTTHYQYDSSGRLERVTAHEGNYVHYTYDSRGNVIGTTAMPKGGGAPIVTSAEYDAACGNRVTCNLPNSVTDARQATTYYTYDPVHGGVTRVQPPKPTPTAVQPETRYTYVSLTPPSGPTVYRLQAVSACRTQASCANSADEVRTTLAYNDPNLLRSSVTTGAGDSSLTATTTTAYDPVGDVASVDGPLAGDSDTVRYRRDAGRQLIGILSPDPDGPTGPLKIRARRNSYNPDGQVTKTEVGTVEGLTDSQWAAFHPLETAEAGYDGAGRPIWMRATGSDGVPYALTQTSYDGEGRVECTAVRLNPADYAAPPASACVAGTAGSVYGPDRIGRNVYDAADQVVQTITGLGGGAGVETAEISTYTGNGKVESVMDGEGNRTTFEYDGFDRLSKTRFPLKTAHSQASASGTASDPAADYEQLSYDDNGNVTTRRLRDGNAIGYSYDALNRLTAKDLPSLATWEVDIGYSYDNLGHLTQALNANAHYVNLGWDSLGRLTGEASSVTSIGYGYDLAGRRTRVAYADGFYVDYDYLATGEVSQIAESNGQNGHVSSGVGLLATFGYDDLGNRISLTRGNGSVTSYRYNAAARLDRLTNTFADSTKTVQTGFDYNPAGQITRAESSNALYSFARSNAAKTYTPNGLNQYVTAGTASPTYDARGNLTSAGTTVFGYTSENKLAAYGSHLMAYDPLGRLHHIQELGLNWAYDSDGRLLVEMNASTGQVARRYVFGPGADEPLVWYEGSGTSDRRFLHADERGSIVAVSNGAGTVTNVNSYDEYGAPASGNAGRFQYTGQAWINEIGLYYYKNRFYSSGLGRFLQTDPIGYGDGLNMYGYVGGDPVNFTDPTGLAVVPCDSEDCNDIVVIGRRIKEAAEGGTGDAALLNSGASSNNIVVNGVRGRPRPKKPAPRAPVSTLGCIGSALWENKTGLLLDAGGWALEAIPVTKVGKTIGGMVIGVAGMIAGAMDKDVAGAGLAYAGKQGAVGEGLGVAAAKRLSTVALVGSTVYDVAKAANSYNQCKSGK
jgi:RHS repeat-associated protein